MIERSLPALPSNIRTEVWDRSKGRTLRLREICGRQKLEMVKVMGYVFLLLCSNIPLRTTFRPCCN